MIVISTATEDELSEAVAIRLIESVVVNGQVGLRLRKGGNGYLRSRLSSICQIAEREHVLLITDLDRQTCASGLIDNWRGNLQLPERLLFRVSVHEIEAWLLADRAGMAGLLGVSESSLPAEPDALPDPKQALLNAAKKAKRSVRSELIASREALASQGLGYNRLLSQFVENVWSVDRAADRSPSLGRAVRRLREVS